MFSANHRERNASNWEQNQVCSAQLQQQNHIRGNFPSFSARACWIQTLLRSNILWKMNSFRYRLVFWSRRERTKKTHANNNRRAELHLGQRYKFRGFRHIGSLLFGTLSRALVALNQITTSKQKYHHFTTSLLESTVFLEQTNLVARNCTFSTSCAYTRERERKKELVFWNFVCLVNFEKLHWNILCIKGCAPQKLSFFARQKNTDQTNLFGWVLILNSFFPFWFFFPPCWICVVGCILLQTTLDFCWLFLFALGCVHIFLCCEKQWNTDSSKGQSFCIVISLLTCIAHIISSKSIEAARGQHWTIDWPTAA